MPNKHFCQGPNCHTYPTSDRFLKSKGIIRGRYAYAEIATSNNEDKRWHRYDYQTMRSIKNWIESIQVFE